MQSRLIFRGPGSSSSLVLRVVPADLELLNLFNDALGYFPAAGRDQSPRHQVKGAAWVGKKSNFLKSHSQNNPIIC